VGGGSPVGDAPPAREGGYFHFNNIETFQTPLNFLKKNMKKCEKMQKNT